MDEELIKARREFDADPSALNMAKLWRLEMHLDLLDEGKINTIKLSAQLGDPASRMVMDEPELSDVAVLSSISEDDLVDLTVYCAELAYPLLQKAWKKEEPGSLRLADRLMDVILKWKNRKSKRPSRRITQAMSEELNLRTRNIWDNSQYSSNIIIKFAGNALYRAGLILRQESDKAKKINIAIEATKVYIALVKAGKRHKKITNKDIIIDFLIGGVTG